MRADYRCPASAERRALRLGAGARGHAVREASCALRRSRSQLRAARTAAPRSRSTQRAGAARPVAARLADDARRDRGDRSTRRSTGSSGRCVARDGLSDRRRGATRSGGGGATRRIAPELGRRARWRCCASELGALRAAAAAPSSSTTSRCPSRASRCRAALVDAVGGGAASAPAPRTGCATPPASGYPDLVRLRAGGSSAAPDAVVLPGRRRRRCARVLEVCAARGRRRRPVRRRHQRGRRRRAAARRASSGWSRSTSRACATVAVDRALADRDARRRPARARRPRRRWRAQGFTLGHFPQSFEYATIGGFAATRSAGQASSGYGRFDALVTSVRLTAPAGELRTLRDARTPPPGPALRELVVGSEGALGVITEVTRAGAPGARRAPLRGLDRRRASRPGAEIVRALAQGGGAARRDPRLRRGGDRRLAGALGPARARRGALLRRLPAAARRAPAAA